MTEKDKIKQYLEYKNISKYKFYQQTGLSAGFLDSGCSIGVDKARIIINTYPDINLSWLIMGEGPMLRDEEGCPAVTDALKQEAVATDTFLSGTQQPIERNSNVGKCSSVKDPIDNIFEAASGPNIEVVRELMAKITEQAIEIGRLRERISLINNGIKNTGGGILPTPSKSNPPKFNPPTPSKSNPPKSNPPAMPAISQPDMLIRKPRTESTSVLVTEKSARSIRKSR